MIVRAPAKVNLRLGVGPLRDDGYHDLVNVFHAVSLFDEVVVEPADRLAVEVERMPGARVDVGQVPCDDRNLAVRAARLVAARLGVEPAVALRIRKAIPVAGGMAGGSADAAAALLACARLWDDPATPILDRAALLGLAAEIGSDVPFALVGGTAVGLGRGERLTAVAANGPFHWVFATADGGLSTPAVYAECDRLRAAGAVDAVWPHDAGDLYAALESGDADVLGAALGNDLEAAALSLRPALGATLDAGKRAGALGALVSGSGPTCAFLAADAGHAERVAEALAAEDTVAAAVPAAGPAPGAAVVRPAADR
ncbi:4-(cytidine 5'-diphospho)-2-C-methyl-D-erythritol kinase [Actinomadura atramentaria]|uniref:4-(cytidine 5'-diphospho)-2-C-methyl-D-erythritol kinase n=1 Tax=Actinomadura atramentaria TaxID=1990 RepID=UPI000365A562|nr:4-(cytidine 5'-diphospho)-2-C-methyl-D-erythritol kinase [Actinomadura atramentaria]